eukprot:TRINITY_DN10676_c0_g1_i2.p1 TRINITY_DN10676_c0_g1~~TRINITY_DN10676_c0_g1_i2.p1  ORF type:complete len:703 (+),score=178.68 TRINITY_DN10676_c0_g1_i2:28-2109(+)
MVGKPHQRRRNATSREGMADWTREKDNRFRELTNKRDDVGLSQAEEEEYGVLLIGNERFIEAGIDFQRGEGVNTQSSLIVLMGYAIGLGNLWRFPYLVGKFGGLSFIIAYFLSLFTVAQPVYMLELAWGQIMRKSTVFAYSEIGKKWVGVGYACVLALVLVQSYYSVLLSYCLVYIYESFKDPLPWTVGNTTAELYWYTDILGLGPNDDVSGLGAIQWHVVVGIVVTYMIVYVAVFRGITVGAKITYVTVGVPCVLVVILCIRALALEGAGDGVRFYLGRFDWGSFVSPVMWAEACAQSLFTLLFLPGTTITLASYMKEKEDIYRIHIIVVAINTLFSIVAGLTVFAILGHAAHVSCEDTTVDNSTCVSVDDMAKNSGAGLAFIAIAQGIGTFGKGSNAFSFLFFLMCFALGLDTTFAGVETLVTYVEDFLIYMSYSKLKREYISAACITLLFLLSLIFSTSNGFLLLDIVDHYVTSYMMLIVCALECFMLMFDISWEVFSTQVQCATTGLLHINNGRGRELPKSIQISLKYIAPLACFGLALTLFIYDCIRPYEKPSGERYSAGYQATGWTLMFAYLLMIPLGGWIARKGFCSQKAASQQYVEMEQTTKSQSNHAEAVVPLLDATHDVHVEEKDIGNTAEEQHRRHDDEEYLPPPGTGKTAELRRNLERIGEEVLSSAELSHSTEGTDEIMD